MKVLLLGGGGFIGNALAEKFAADKGNSIISYGRYPKQVKNERNNIRIISGEFRNLREHYALIEDSDLIIHTISSLLPVSDSFSDETENVISPTIHLLDHFKNSGKHFIFLSSGGAVYELNPGTKLTEEMPRKAYNFYGLSKIMLEDVFLFYREKFGIPVTIVRPSNVYGYRNNHIGINGIISTLISNCAEGQVTDIWGSGEAVRDYIYIGDFTEAVYRVAEKKLTGVFNISGNNAKSINEIISIINRYAEDKCNIRYKENLYHLPEHIIADNAKIATALPLGRQSVFEEKIEDLVLKYYAARKKAAEF